MNDIAQQNLREPDQTDWNNYNTGASKYVAPPPALDAGGKAITYYGIADAKETEADEGLLNYTLDVKVQGLDALRPIRTWASVKPFQKNGEPIKGNPSKLGNFLRATGLGAKPQTNEEWRAAVRAAAPRRIGFTIDWEAKNRDTGETVKGYLSFPDDPERPGTKKAILKRGDYYTVRDFKGVVLETKQVESEVLFANPRIKFFQDPTRGAK